MTATITTTEPTTMTPADAILEAIRALALDGGLWCEADDEAIAAAAGLDARDVVPALAELEQSGRIGAFDARIGVAGRVVYPTDHPRAGEVAAMQRALARNLDVRAPKAGPRKIARATARAGWVPFVGVTDLELATLPYMAVTFPAGPLVPATRCRCAVAPIRPGERVICGVCHRSGLDDRIARKLVADDRRARIEAEVAAEHDDQVDPIETPPAAAEPGRRRRRAGGDWANYEPSAPGPPTDNAGPATPPTEPSASQGELTDEAPDPAASTRSRTGSRPNPARNGSACPARDRPAGWAARSGDDHAGAPGPPGRPSGTSG